MITTENYYQQISSIDLTKLPEVGQKGNALADKVMQHSTDWSVYHNSRSIKKTIDIYLLKLNELATASTKSALKKKKRGSPGQPVTPK